VDIAERKQQQDGKRKQLPNLYSSTNVIRVIKSRRNRRPAHVARMVEMRKS